MSKDEVEVGCMSCRVMTLLAGLAFAQQHCDDGRSIDEAFVWEPHDIERRPLVTFGMIREASAILQNLGAGGSNA